MSIHTVQYEGIELEYELIRKDVKYINLRVTRRGSVVVSAAKRVPLSVIEEFVQSKAHWIITHLAEIEQMRQSLPNSVLTKGKTLYYLGRPYRLVLTHGAAEIHICGDEIHMSAPTDEGEALRAQYLGWLKAEAQVKFESVMDTVYPLVAQLGIQRPTIQIRNMRSIWGSCTTSGNSIRLNLQLMKADEDCIAQVVLHELLHFLHKNHGDAFYALLESLMPDWKVRKLRLESNYKDGV